jgi:hypothetical protein
MKTKFKEWFNKKPENKNQKEDLGKKYKSLFLGYCDGCYDDFPKGDANTFQMGICLLQYNEKENVLEVYLRRPGLLIGKGGENIKGIEEYLGIKIKIHEINLL